MRELAPRLRSGRTGFLAIIGARAFLASLALGAALLFAPARASAVAVDVEIYLVYWPSIGGTANEVELDRFMACLLEGTSYAQFFSKWGGATLTWGGGVGLSSAPPNNRFGACDGDVGYVDNLLNRDELPVPSMGILPMYVFMMPEGLIASNCYDAGRGGCDLWPDCGQLCVDSVCGLNPGETNYDVSQPWLEAWVTTYATCCWTSGRTDLNLETSVIEHEVAEAVATAMGGLSTCADGCESDTLYPFTGCPSAAGEPTSWYELQNLSTLHTASCDYEVDYTGLACSDLGAVCGDDGGCCAPLVCRAADAGLECCYPEGARCVLSADCCDAQTCVDGRCTTPVADGGVARDAGAPAKDGGPSGAPPPGRGCSSAGGSPATWLTLLLLALVLRRSRMLASRATEAP